MPWRVLTALHQQMSFLSILKLFLEPMIITSLTEYLQLKSIKILFFSFLHLSFVKDKYAFYLEVVSKFLKFFFIYQLFKMFLHLTPCLLHKLLCIWTAISFGFINRFMYNDCIKIYCILAYASYVRFLNKIILFFSS